MTPGWDAWEEYVAGQLRLSRTCSSGNKFHDPGDAVTRNRGGWPIYAECKYTERLSFGLKLREVRQAHYQAEQLGKRFVMPIRIWPRGDALGGPGDYALIPLADLVELLDKAERAA